MDKPELKDLPSAVQEAVAGFDRALTLLATSREIMRSQGAGMVFGGSETVSQTVVGDAGKSGSLER